MIPDFNQDGLLPQGIHVPSDWNEFKSRFGWNSHRQNLLTGMKSALISLESAGCQCVYVDGSFVTNKERPNDFDICWDMTGVEVLSLDPLFLKFDSSRLAQKIKCLGEFFPANFTESGSGKTFLEFFQIDRVTGNPKGIIVLKLWEMWT